MLGKADVQTHSDTFGVRARMARLSSSSAYMNMQKTVMRWILTVAFFLSCAPAWPQANGDPSNRPVRVALMSDLHITRGTREEQPFHKSRLERTITAINSENVDLVLIAGDLTENGTRAEFGDLRQLLKRLQAPVWFVPGNHDLGGKVIAGKNDPKAVTPERVGTFEWRLGPSWFCREHGGVRVIGVNASLLGSGLPAEAGMWKLLEQELGAPLATPTLMVLHNPPFTRRPDEPGGVYWNVEPKPRRRLLELVHRGAVRAVLSGHLHTEEIRRQDGILFVTTPPVAFGLPKGRQYRGWTLLTVPAQGEVQAEFRYLVD